MSEKIVQLNEEVIKGQLKELVRGSVEETLNELLEQEAEKLTQAARYERNETRQGYRSGHYDRNLTTTSGDVTLHVPRLKGVSFETAIIERYVLLIADAVATVLGLTVDGVPGDAEHRLLFHQRDIVAACAVPGRHGGSHLVRSGVAGVDAVVLIDQRLMSMLLGAKGSGYIHTAFHDAAALVVETQDARHHVRAAICCLQCRGAFLLVPDITATICSGFFLTTV